MSAAAFARQQRIGYTTFCGWRHRRAQSKASPGFFQVEVTEPTESVELVIELGAAARLRIRSASQIELAARLVKQLNASATC